MAVTKKGGLGRSLDALIGDVGQGVLDQPEFETLKQIDVAKIQPGRYQPRKNFHDEGLKELALSIAEHGILQPLVVRPIAGERYEIIAGERRFRAGQQAGLSQVPCVVKNYDDKQALAVALIENLQRSDLNALEVAEGLSRLVDEFELTHERAAQLVGRSRSSVTNTLRLLELSEPVKEALGDGLIEMGHARALLALTPYDQELMLKEVLKKYYTVRQTEVKVKQWLNPSAVEKEGIGESDQQWKDIERALAKQIGASVSIIHKKKGHGKIVFKYHDIKHLEAILTKIGYQ